MTSIYAKFPARETIQLDDISDIRPAVDRIVKTYFSHSTNPDFSVRILLPRGEKLTGKAKRIGISFQGEFLIGLRRKNRVPKVREVRYLHDEAHYGWILASPQVFDLFENKTQSG